MSADETRAYNRSAWNHQVATGNEWTLPVDAETIARARTDDWSVVLTPNLPVPRDWFFPLRGCRILGLASAGGQQMPTFAAAGAEVTVLDISESQLGQDRLVAEREGLEIVTKQGDMTDLSAFDDGAFDLVFHPCSNGFSPEILPVWREAFRVLRSGGRLLSGFTNPVAFLFDEDEAKEGRCVLRHSMPYSDADSLSPEELRRRYTDAKEPIIYAHSLEDQIGGQLRAGFVLSGFFEDYGRDKHEAFDKHAPLYIATRAEKPA